jgi:hypothetical protein
MWGLIAAFLVIDVAMTIWVVRRIRRRAADGRTGGDARRADIDNRPIH